MKLRSRYVGLLVVSVIVLGLVSLWIVPKTVNAWGRADVTVDISLPSDSTGVPGGALAVRIFAPASAGDARYADGAPVLIFVPGGTDAGTLRPALSQAEDVIRIVFLFPGGTDPLAGRSSDGTYDYRGANSIAALRDVIRYAAGELTDSLGRTIDDVLPVPVLHDNIGLLGGSNGGNVIVAVAGEHGGDLNGYLRYIVQWESPVSSQIATADLGRVRLDCPPGPQASLPAVNPRYQSYGPLVLDVDYTQLTYDASDPLHPVFFDGTGDGHYTTVVDPQSGCQTPDLNLNGDLELNEDFPLSTFSDGVKQFYSGPVTQALADQNVFGSGWPTDVATPPQTNAFWNLREAVRHYPAALANIPDLEGMVLTSVVDHVQTAPDHPHIHQAFDGWDGNGDWVKINPARDYVLEVDPSLSSRTDLPDNAANTAPADWTDAGSYAFPDGLDEVYFAAAVHEMADRAHATSGTPTPTSTSTPTPTSTPSPTPTLFLNHVYLPLVMKAWDQSWPTPTATPTPTSTPLTDDAPPLYFFYAIHTHVQGDWFPYTDLGMTELDSQVADNMIAAIDGIAQVLDDHGAKGSWEVVYGASKGLCEYQGENHIFQQLVDSGHEVGVHAHRTVHIESAFQNLEDYCGISANLTSGFMIEAVDAGPEGAQETLSQAIEESLSFGMTVGTENLSPSDPRNPFAELCDDQIGVGNDMWAEAGNLMFPWRPDYINQNICADNPAGDMVFVDHAPPGWMILPEQGKVDVLTDANFDQLREQFDAALAYMEENRPERVAAWGFVSHINEYAVGSQGENPPHPGALAALDQFLDYVDSKVAEGRVIYAPASEIADLAFSTTGN